MEFKNEYLYRYSDDSNKSNDILDELFMLAKYDATIQTVLEYYKYDMQYSYPQLLTNLNEILMSVTKSLLDKSNSLERSLGKVMRESDKPI